MTSNLKDLISSLEGAIDHYALLEADRAILEENHGRVSQDTLRVVDRARATVTRLIDEIVEEASCAVV